VTLALALRRRFPWAHVVPYWIAQVVGAFAGAALVMAVYHDSISAYNTAAHLVPSAGNALASYSIFATFPSSVFHGSIGGPFLDEAVGTALLVLGVFAVTDARNSAPLSNMGPLIVGFIVFAVGTSFGAQTGYAINPARDFGPRLFAYIAGYGQVALPGTFNNGAGFSFSNYFWIPIIGPLLGGCVGGLAYDFFIGDVLHARKTGTAQAVPSEPGRAEANVQPERL
jgi:glycerol uptake facilitator protein